MTSMVIFYKSVSNVMNVLDKVDKDVWECNNATKHMVTAYLNAEGSEKDEIEATRTFVMTMDYARKKLGTELAA